MNVIETANLTKSYGKNRGIEDVSLTVGESEIFGFIGPNGAGKSTFIRTILNFIYPTEGSGKVLGRDIESESHKFKEEIGYVPSEVNYYEESTVLEMLNYALSFRNKAKREDVEDLSKKLKLDLDKKIGELSLGNKKKVAIAQALLAKPKLLILDEPTSGLDPLMQKKLFEILRNEKKKGNTVFLSSHNLSEVESLCDRVAIIREGKIVEVLDLKKAKEKFGMRIELEGEVEKEDLLKIAGDIIYESSNHFIFTYTGDINDFLNWTLGKRFQKLTIKEQNLEEEFMKYYLDKGDE